MRKRLLLIAVVTFFSYNFILPQVLPEKQVDPLKVVKFGSDYLNISWKIQELEIYKTTTNGEIQSHVTFDGCNYPQVSQGFEIPMISFRLGIPKDSEVSFELSNIVYEVIGNINLAPERIFGRDKHGISISKSGKAPARSSATIKSIIRLDDQQFFRDLPVVQVDFYPVQYDSDNRELKIIKSANIQFKFAGARSRGGYIPGGSKLDQLYDQMVINFNQAKNWVVRERKSFNKAFSSFQGPWYKIEVTREGLYRINASALSEAGINTQNIDPRTIKIYNHGGNTLNPNTATYTENPVGPVENAIYIAGEEDGQLDSQDYILFYGTGAGGWYYSDSENDFIFTQHLYDTKNFYLLTYGEGTGKRMKEESTPSGGAGVTDTYFMERVHYEEDKYNLMASGSDWYGYRFFDTAHDISLNYMINNVSSISNLAQMKIKFKGGYRKYDDNVQYLYNFSVWLNSTKAPSALITNHSLRNENSVTISRNFNPTDYLQEGTNSVYIKYTANRVICNAYLDWVEFFYPRNFMAVNNQLMFYSNTLGQILQYDIGNFSESNVEVYDISNPVDVKILLTNSTVQNGTLKLNLDQTDGKAKKMLVSSLNSAEIIDVSSLIKYQPRLNLMDESLSADLIIITHPSFESYANEIVELRATGFDPISGIVVNTDDIYFYFSSGVKDVIAIRNFIRHAYYNWSSPRPSYVLLFGDGHYDYRNIALPDTNRIPPFEISADQELESRESDNFYVDVNFTGSNYSSITPDLAVGRLPAESDIDGRRIVDKLRAYEQSSYNDGWQTILTFVGDDEVTSIRNDEWIHQRQTELMAQLSQLKKFMKKKIYLSAYESVPGGFGRVKPKANQAIIDQLNEGTLLINYVGHGSPTVWAHESVLDMTRDLNRIENENRLPLWIAVSDRFWNDKLTGKHALSNTDFTLENPRSRKCVIIRSTSIN